MLLHAIFEETAQRSPDVLAVKAGSQAVTYAELDNWANDIAAAITRTVPVDPDGGTIIGLCLSRGIAAVAGMLGILKAGCAWVALDPAYPQDRLRFMLEDTGAPLVLTTTNLLAINTFLSDVTIQTICLDAPLVQAPACARPSIRCKDRLAYVLYTSGSTGRPKGVLGTHGAMLSRFAWMWEAFPFAPDEVCCSKTALNFADSIWETLGGLLKGIPSVVADEATARDPFRLLELLAQEKVTRLIVVPSLLAAMLEAARAMGIKLPHLRYLTSSGELLPSDLARQVGELGENITLLNLYGSSEMAADATCCVMTSERLDGKIAPIGIAIGQMRIHVLDEDLQPVAVGVQGELCVSGPGLALGYLGRPDLTQEKFIANPFVPPDDPMHARLFRSGDVVSMRPDGHLDYVGRKDFQIKVRGFRIEPGEVETTLATHPAIRACAVAALENHGLNQLVAFCVTPALEGAQAGELRDYLRARLPDYMVPSRYVRLEALPLLPNGKLDRKALRLPNDAEVSAPDAAEANKNQRLLLDIWVRVLRQSAIGLDDDFFAIGGDSIQAFRVAAEVRAKGFALTPFEVHTHPTIRALALYLENRNDAPGEHRHAHWSAPGLTTPLSPMQSYYFSWAKPNPHKFNVGFIARLGTLLDEAVLAQALEEVVKQHDALRLRFILKDDGDITQHHIPLTQAAHIPLHRFMLPDGAHDVQLQAIREAVARLHDTLDITHGPVMTLAQFEDPNGRNHHLFLTMHELVTDALSLQVTLEDLRTAYQAAQKGERVQLPAQTTPYHEWVEKVMSYARSPRAQGQLEYWLKQAEGAHPFPEDAMENGALQSDIVSYGFQVLDAGEVEALRQLHGGGAQATLIHAIVGGLAVTANALSGQKDLIFHKVAHGRETCIPGADPSRTVGWFITHTPITVRLPDDGVKNPARVLEYVAAQYRAIPDNGIGHSALRYYSGDPRAVLLAREDQVRTLFQYIGDVWEDNYDGEIFLPTDPSLMDVPDTVAAENLADYHLHVYAYLMDGCFRMKFFYTRQNYKAETIMRMAGLFTGAVKGMVFATQEKQPEEPVSSSGKGI